MVDGIIIAAVSFVSGILITYFQLGLKIEYDKRKEIEGLKNRMGEIYGIASTYKSVEQKRKLYELIREETEWLIWRFSKYKSIEIAAIHVQHWSELIIYHEQEDGPQYLDENKTVLREKFNLFLKECSIELSIIKSLKNLKPVKEVKKFWNKRK